MSIKTYTSGAAEQLHMASSWLSFMLCVSFPALILCASASTAYNMLGANVGSACHNITLHVLLYMQYVQLGCNVWS